VDVGALRTLGERAVELILRDRELALIQVGDPQLHVVGGRIADLVRVPPVARYAGREQQQRQRAGRQAGRDVQSFCGWVAHGCTATPMTLAPRRTVVRSMTRPASCPQAASMSSPRVRRMVASTPRCSSSSRKRWMTGALERV